MGQKEDEVHLVKINPAAEAEIKQLLEGWWSAVSSQLAVVSGSAVQIGAAQVDLLYQSEIGQRLVRIAAAAEGQLEWSLQIAQGILDDCRAFETWINQALITQRTPEEFWATPVGYRVLRAQVWAAQDRLISLSEAAVASGMSLSVLSQRISRGQITGFRDPHTKNPQRARRIRLSDLNRLLDQRMMRKPHTYPGLAPSGNFKPDPVYIKLA